MKPSTWIPLAILAIVTSVFGMYTALGQSGQTSEHITGTWTLIDAEDASGEIDVSPTAVVLTVDDSTIGGTVCNHFGGEYSISGSTLSIASLANTEMWCETPAGIMDLESRFLPALAAANTVRFEGTNLVLTGVDIRLVFAQSTPD